MSERGKTCYALECKVFKLVSGARQGPGTCNGMRNVEAAWQVTGRSQRR
jgi:hypothetical protein